MSLGIKNEMKLVVKNDEKELVAGLPNEEVTLGDNKVAMLKDQTVIINDLEDEIVVGFKAVVMYRSGSKMSAEQFGDLKSIPKNSTIKDIIDAINEVVEGVRTFAFGKPSEA